MLPGSTVVTLMSKGAKSSATCAQMFCMDWISELLNVPGSPSVSYAGVVRLL